MLPLQAMAFSLMLTPVDLSECHPTKLSPDVEITAERGQPDFKNNASINQITQNSTGAYRPQGVGPAWHTTGLTQSNITIEQKIANHSLTASDNSYSCIFVDKIELTVVLAPVVWVANEFPQGTCMFNAVRGHELKHVNVDRLVTDRHLDRIRGAMIAASAGRAFFGPGKPDDVKGKLDQFVADLKTEMDLQAKDFFADESRSQQAVDTIQEYQRISNLCASQLNAMHQ